MWNLAITRADLLMPGGHVFLFFSAEQSGHWVSCFKKCREDSRNEQDDDKTTTMKKKKKKKGTGKLNSLLSCTNTILRWSTHGDITIFIHRGAGDLQNSLVEYKNYGYIPSR